MLRESSNPAGRDVLTVFRALVLLAAGTSAFPLASAQSTDEPKGGQADIQEALRTGKTFIDVDVLVSTAGAQARGENDAKVAMVEFFDYECPYCGVHADLALPQVLAEYVQTGKLRYVFRNFPVERLHPLADWCELVRPKEKR